MSLTDPVARRRADDGRAVLEGSIDSVYRIVARLVAGDEGRAEFLLKAAVEKVRKSEGFSEADLGHRLMQVTLGEFASRFWSRRPRAGEVPLEGESRLEDEARVALQERIRELPDPVVLSAFDRLPEAVRVPVALRDIAGMGYQEIASLLGLSREDVGTRIVRARRRLLRRLAEEALGRQDPVDPSI